MKNCTFCGNKNLRKKNVQYIFKHGGDFLVVNNVPCLECEYCGEQYFKANIVEAIEKDFKAIQGRKKKARKTLKVPMEEFTDFR